MARFFPLTVINIAQETHDAVAVTLKPRKQDEAAFDFIQGQYLTFRKDFDGEELRRSYSSCAGKGEKINGEPVLRVGIKRVEGGLFSNWANDNLTIGDMLETMPPMGKFYTKIEPEKAKNYSAFVAGSGITPVLSIIKTVLAQEEKAHAKLVLPLMGQPNFLTCQHKGKACWMRYNLIRWMRLLLVRQEFAPPAALRFLRAKWIWSPTTPWKIMG